MTVDESTEQALRRFIERREAEASLLKIRLARAARWQKRYDKVTDKTVEAQTKDRTKKVFDLAKEKGITVWEISPYSSIDAEYLRGEVRINLKGYLQISSDGVASVHFKSSTGKSVMRISVGKTIRVVDNVLASLI